MPTSRCVKCSIDVATHTTGQRRATTVFSVFALRCFSVVCAQLTRTLFARFVVVIYSERHVVLARGAGHRPKSSAPFASPLVRGAGHRPKSSAPLTG